MTKRILIIGATGMLGHVLFRHLSANPEYEVFGTSRSLGGLHAVFPSHLTRRFRQYVDADNFDSVIRALASIQPDIVINCIGLIKQLPLSSDPLSAITVNAQLPHRISLISRTAGARMIHISTDCVFNGVRGNYTESDPSCAEDLYGQTKYLGEVTYPHCVTLRTSIIGHELKGGYGLVDWFLAQEGSVRGFTKAIYSGFPTIELARVISDYILPNQELSGLYHVSSNPISKYELLRIIARRYDKKIAIDPYDDFVIDRSLDSSRFRSLTGYVPPEWDDLVEAMFRDYEANNNWYAKLL
ncbi:SDR family oxidoreductase [Geobacter sp.]|uniref:dTDP-4-dehydrorhamnose reductase family protein n=1 Tax=Geobacter sp. TaxID=46610 RepID=UPI0027B9A976|nr:SDR family oxidoreductase [Geobacter sp.]